MRSGAVSSRSGPTKPHAARKAAGRVRVDVYLDATAAEALEWLSSVWETTKTETIAIALRALYVGKAIRPGRAAAAKRREPPSHD
jgi:hypothetical protein